MKVSRADFLKICGAAALGRGVNAGMLIAGFAPTSSGQAAVASRSSAGPFLLRNACADHFRPHVNTVFTVRSLAGVPMRLVLARVTEGPRAPAIEQFSIVFHGPARQAVSQGTHAFHHQALGAFDLFIAPVGGSDARRTVYEACFSRHMAGAERAPGSAGAAQAEDETCRVSS